MNPPIADEALMAEFITLAEEHLTTAELLLIDLEKGGNATVALQELFRHYHTLKGDAGVMGAHEIEALAHEIESLLDRLRSGELTAGPSLIDLLMEATTELRKQLTAFGEGKAGPLSDVAGRLRNFSSSEKGPRTRIEKQIEQGEEGTGERESCIVFQVGSTHAAISVQDGHEIIQRVPITRVPNVPPFVAGVINHQGKIIPVLSLSQRLQIHLSEKESLVLVLFVRNMYVAFLVHSVLTVADFEQEEIFKPDAEFIRLDASCVRGAARFQEHIVFLLNLDAVLARDASEEIKNQGENV